MGIGGVSKSLVRNYWYVTYGLGCTPPDATEEAEEVELFLGLCKGTHSVEDQVYQVGPLEDLDAAKQLRQGGKDERALCKSEQEY